MQFTNDNPVGWREWSNMQQKHRMKIKNIYDTTSTRIDNRLPKILMKSTSSKPATVSIYGSVINLREIDRKNAAILDKLTRMARSPAVLKTLPTAANKVDKRKYFLKKLENIRIHNDNMQFAKRLATTTSSVNFKKYEIEFQNSQKYLQIRKRAK